MSTATGYLVLLSLLFKCAYEFVNSGSHVRSLFASIFIVAAFTLMLLNTKFLKALEDVPMPSNRTRYDGDHESHRSTIATNNWALMGVIALSLGGMFFTTAPTWSCVVGVIVGTSLVLESALYLILVTDHLIDECAVPAHREHVGNLRSLREEISSLGQYGRDKDAKILALEKKLREEKAQQKAEQNP